MAILSGVAALAAGYSQQQIDAMGDDDSALFMPKKQAVLALGSVFAIENGGGSLTPELHARMRNSDAEILERGFVAAILSGWTKLIFAYDLVRANARSTAQTAQSFRVGRAVRR